MAAHYDEYYEELAEEARKVNPKPVNITSEENWDV